MPRSNLCTENCTEIHKLILHMLLIILLFNYILSYTYCKYNNFTYVYITYDICHPLHSITMLLHYGYITLSLIISIINTLAALIY